jgi:hypothetical protein
MAAQQKHRKPNNRPKTNNDAPSSSSLGEMLGDKMAAKLKKMTESNIKDMVKNARSNPKVIEAEKNLSK